MGPICLIIDDEGAISCLGWRDEDRHALLAEEWGRSPQRWADSCGIHSHFGPCFHLLQLQAALMHISDVLPNTYLSTILS